jgi:Fic family protein
MRFPALPPPEDDMLLIEEPGRLGPILANVPGPTYRGRYLHWDKLRHYPPPEGLTHKEWWLGLKFRRRGSARSIPLTDKEGRRFTFSLVDPLPEDLHLLDLSASGHMEIPRAILDPATRDRYLVHSLMEEAITSSQLEGAATTHEVAKEMLREGRPPRSRSERMIINNHKTMQRIVSIKDSPLTKDLVFELHRMVTLDTIDDNSAPGRFRRADERVYVTNQDEEALHTPPPAGELAKRMELMCEFANGGATTEFIHPAIRSMILHFWLAYDHPFIDGNGRTARALFYWSMLNNGYRLCEFVSISEIILKAPAKYGRAFLYTETDDNDLTYFLIYHAEIVRRAIRSLESYVELRSKELQSLEAKLRGVTALNYRQRDLISHALRHAGFRYTIESHRASHNVAYQTARTDLLDLAARGLLLQHKRGKAWHFTPVHDLEVKLKELA